MSPNSATADTAPVAGSNVIARPNPSTVMHWDADGQASDELAEPSI